MKVRNFYPRQVAGRLNGRRFNQLSPGERKAFEFFARRNRRHGYILMRLDDGICRALDVRFTGQRVVETVHVPAPSLSVLDAVMRLGGSVTTIEEPVEYDLSGYGPAWVERIKRPMPPIPATVTSLKPGHVALSDGTQVDIASGMVRHSLLIGSVRAGPGATYPGDDLRGPSSVDQGLD